MRITGGKSVSANLSWTLLGSVLYLASQLGILSVLAHAGSIVDVGRYGLTVALAAPVFMFFNLNLRIGQASDVMQNFPSGVYLALRIVTTVIAVFVCFGITAIGYDTDTMWFMVMVAAAKAAESFSDLCYGLFQQRERADLMARSFILRGLLTLLLFAAVLWSTHSVVFALSSQVLIWSLVALAHDMPAARRQDAAATRPLFDAVYIGKLAWVSLPLGISALIAALHLNAPRYILESLLGLKALGFFTVIIYLVQMGTMLANLAGQSILGRLSRLQAAGQGSQLRSLVFRLCLVANVLGAAGIAVSMSVGGQLLTVAFGEDYAFLQTSLTIAAAAVAIRLICSFLQISIFAGRQFTSYSVLEAILLPPSLGIFYLFVDRGGIEGGAWAILLMAVMRLATLLFEVRRHRFLM